MILVAVAAAAVATALPPKTERTPNLYQPPGRDCRDIARRVSADQAEAFRRLGALPNGARQYAVLRQIDGCPVPAPMGYHPPALPGAADAPAMRGDGPSNRPTEAPPH